MLRYLQASLQVINHSLQYVDYKLLTGHVMNTLLDTMSKFPLSVAMGKAFCNRKQELKMLQAWLLQKRPVLMMSPRRYGKTSLALSAIKKIGLPYAHIDLFSVVDEDDIERVILSANLTQHPLF